MYENEGAGTPGLLVTANGTDAGMRLGRWSISRRLIHEPALADDLDDEVLAEGFLVRVDDESTALLVGEMEVAGEPTGGEARQGAVC